MDEEAPPSAAPEKADPSAKNLRRSEVVRLPSDETDRVSAARPRVEPTLRELFTRAGASYPPKRLFFRAFKREAELEVWAVSKMGTWNLVTTYAVASASGGPGPKRIEGDFQVPEGFYEIDRYNPKSSFHLSLGINYPNASDKILSNPDKPGYDIFIHGRDLSAGCLAMGDDMIEEIYIAALDTKQKPIRVHIFPARMNAPDWESWKQEQLLERPDVEPFWANLAEGWRLFEEHRVVPNVSVGPGGRYRFNR